ncbi:MAG: N-acetylmuramoyl-L-alanine amidase [Ahrensia sp.]
MTELIQPDFADATLCPSPNVSERRGAATVDMLLLHYTGMEGGQAAQDWLCNPESQVSCHYIVHENGEIIQMVAENARAWHAGAGEWLGVSDTNSRSIGIEIVNGGHPAGLPTYPDVQMAAVARLARDIINRHAIAPWMVLAHSDIAPGRKLDPGEHFDWGWLHGQGVGHWVPPGEHSGGRFFALGDHGQPVEALQSMLTMYGYGVPITGAFCERTKVVVEAFQRHFRQSRVDGVADANTIDVLYRLLAARQQ